MINAVIQNLAITIGKNRIHGGDPTEVDGTVAWQFPDGTIIKTFFNTAEEARSLKDAYRVQKQVNDVLEFIIKAAPIMEEFAKDFNQKYISIPDYAVAFRVSLSITTAMNAFLIKNQCIDLVKLRYLLIELEKFLDNWVRVNGKRTPRYPEIQHESKLTTPSEKAIARAYITELDLGDDGLPYIVWTSHEGETMITNFDKSTDLKEWYNG